MAETAAKKMKWKTETVEASGQLPGAAVQAGGVVFSAAFPTDGDVTLLLYTKGSEEPAESIPMPLVKSQGLWRSVKVNGLKASQAEYNYLVEGRVVPDPAAALVSGRGIFGDDTPRKKGQIRCRIPSAVFDWGTETGQLQIPYEETIAYLLHVRGFTRQKGSRVKHPGTFRGIEEKIPYLKELGINQIILMPAYEFDEILRPQSGTSPSPYSDPENVSDTYRLNYWGYGDGLYFAPKASYAASARPDIEFKSMVRALHLAGIELVMEFAFADGTDIDYMAQCLTWWSREYHVDGFVLMTHESAAQALASYPALRLTKLMSSSFHTNLLYPHGRKISHRMAADYNDGFRSDMRRMLKGDAGMLRAFIDRTRCNERDKAVINFITGHDGFTLTDLVTYQQKYNEANGEGGRDGGSDELSWNCGQEGPSRKKAVQKLRLQQMKNAMSMLLLSQGTPVLLAGDELGNTQGGNNNPWCQDNETSWIDWKAAKNNQELFAYIQELIAFRKTHGILHRGEPLTGGDRAACGFPDFSCHSESAWYSTYEPENRHIGLMYSGLQDGEESCVYIAYNFHWEEREFAIPYLPEGKSWKLALSSDSPAGSLPEEIQEQQIHPVRSFTVPGRTIRIYESTAVEPEMEEHTPADVTPEDSMEADRAPIQDKQEDTAVE